MPDDPMARPARFARNAARLALRLAAGSLLVWALAEGGFWLAHWILRPGLARLAEPPRSDEQVVLAVGDSFTYGIGAGGQSYPFQLEGLLNGAGSSPRWKVINLGIAGLTSSQLADRLDADIARIRPAAVTIITGSDNFWNSLRVRPAGAAPTLRMRLAGLLQRLRTYRFARLLWVGIRYGSLRGFHREHGGAGGPRDWARRMLRRDKERDMDLGWLHEQLDRPQPGQDNLRAATDLLALDLRDPGTRAEAYASLCEDGERAGRPWRGPGPDDPSPDACRAETLFQLARCHDLAGKPRRAGDLWASALAGDRCRPEVLMARGRYELWRQDLPRARRSLSEALALSPRSAQVQAAMADYFFSAKDYDRAIAHYRKASALATGRDPGHEIRIAVCLEAKGRGRDAEALLEDIIRRFPDDDWAYKTLCDVRYKRRDFHGLETAARRALRRFPDSESIFWIWTVAHERQGRLPQAVAAARADPSLADNPMAQYLNRLGGRLAGDKADFLRDLDRSMAEDVRRISAICARRGVKLILASYPEERFDAVARTAREAGVPFIDFTRIFRERFRSPKEYMAWDHCHSNAAGYLVIAQAFARRLSP